MKFDAICSIAHNLADSFGSGASLLFNNFGVFPYDDAAQSFDGTLEIDFLSGRVTSGVASTGLQIFISMAPDVLNGLCERHGQSSKIFKSLSVRYLKTDFGREFAVTVEDQNGRNRTDRYEGVCGKRLHEGKHPPVANV